MEIRRSSTHKFPLLFSNSPSSSQPPPSSPLLSMYIKYGWGGAIKVAAQCSSSFYACHLLSFRLYSLTQAKQQNGIVSLSFTVEFSFKVDNHRIISYCVLYSVHWIRFIDNDVLCIYIRKWSSHLPWFHFVMHVFGKRWFSPKKKNNYNNIGTTTNTHP